MFLVEFVCQSICLSVFAITAKVKKNGSFKVWFDQ